MTLMPHSRTVKKQQSLNQFFTRKPPNDGTLTPTNDHTSPQQSEGLHAPATLAQKRKRESSAEGFLWEANHNGAASLDNSALAFKSSVRIPANFVYSTSRDDARHKDIGGKDTIATKLHEAFVTKLAGPNALINDKWRRDTTQNPYQSSEASSEDENQSALTSINPGHGGRQTKKHQRSRASTALTPLEKQILDIKHENMDTILAVEVGYKVRFFGEDARIVARELGLVCIPGKYRFDEHISEAHLDRLASASIPVHRLQIHVKRLVSAGLKVGIVRQIETAALKAIGNNRNAPFERKLTNLYTRGTYVDESEGLGTECRDPDSSHSGYILCLAESKPRNWGSDERVRISIVAVQPSTGDILYDDFEDGFMRSELGTRLFHVDPVELVIIGELSSQSQNIIYQCKSEQEHKSPAQPRIEHIPRTKKLEVHALSHVTQFFKQRDECQSKDDPQRVVDDLQRLSAVTVVCLSAMIQYLTAYGLEHVCLLTRYFRKFESTTHMLLNGATLNNLEVLQNQGKGDAHGTLLWALDRTQTFFGRRMLRLWVSQPLLDRDLLEARFDAVEELGAGRENPISNQLHKVLKSIKIDLEKALVRVFYGRSTRKEVFAMLQTFHDVAMSLSDISDQTFTAKPLIQDIPAFPLLRPLIGASLAKLNETAIAEDKKEDFFRSEHESENVKILKAKLQDVYQRFEEHRKDLTKILRKQQVHFATISGLDFLVEVEHKDLLNIPANWIKISSTKKHSRFHTPRVVELLSERDQVLELLASTCEQDFQSYLKEVSENYFSYRDAILSLARLDCLLSLAVVARQPGYVRPRFNDDGLLDIRGGRHPVVERIKLESYISNDFVLDRESRGLLLTGPNMGGKSSYVRQAALIVIMAQIGSFVPATSANVCIVDGIFTRMGAMDNIMDQKSTFMVELQETAEILKRATSRSLVILDELGRGTSTHDGISIARAVLDYMLEEVRCFLLFITHYQDLAEDVASFSDEAIQNVHMAFILDSSLSEDVKSALTFLYTLTPGTAHRSYGLNVARMAALPKDITSTAEWQSCSLERALASKALAQALITL